MYLRANHWLLLLGPVVLALLLWFFRADLATLLDYAMEKPQPFSDTRVERKAGLYLQIESKKNLYEQVQAKESRRADTARWAAHEVLFEPAEAKKAEQKALEWQVQMVIPKNKLAIINHKLVHAGREVDGAVLVAVESDRVLLRVNERLQWYDVFR